MYGAGGTIVPGRVGLLPEACAALNRMAVNVQLLTVERHFGRAPRPLAPGCLC